MQASLFRTIGVAAGAALLLVACPVPIPSGYYDSRANVPASVPESIRKGESTREDILMQFGEPDTVAVDESWVEYGSSYSLGGLALIMCAGTGCIAVSATNMRFRRMIVEFDETGVTAEIIVESKDCFQYAGGGWGSGGSGGKGGETKPCMDSLGLDVPETLHLPSVRE